MRLKSEVYGELFEMLEKLNQKELHEKHKQKFRQKAAPLLWEIANIDLAD